MYCDEKFCQFESISATVPVGRPRPLKDSPPKEQEEDFETPTMSFESFLTYDAPTSVKKKKKAPSSSSSSHSRQSHPSSSRRSGSPPPVPSSSKVSKANGAQSTKRSHSSSSSAAAAPEKRKRVSTAAEFGFSSPFLRLIFCC